jgi:Trypsin
MSPLPRSRLVLAVVLASAWVAPAALAAERSAGGATVDGQSWTARSLIVGTGSTATLVAGGDPIYTVGSPRNGGVVALTMNFGGSSFICTGTLLEDRQSVLTAAHCVTDLALNTPDSAVAYFYGGDDPDTVVNLSPVSTPIGVAGYSIHPLYTGDVIDQNDVAVLRLASPAPDFAPSFALYAADLSGQGVNLLGYGARSSVGGSLGAHLSTGRLRQGDNRFDFRLGDAVFAGAWVGVTGEPLAQIEHSWLTDFDSGLADNDLSCRSVQGLFSLAADPRWCDLGVGMLEAGLAGGDSGGPGFIDGRIASINSYGLSFEPPGFGDVDGVLNSSFGEYSGYVPVYLHTGFISASMVPELGSGSLTLAGLACMFMALRRRSQQEPR